MCILSATLGTTLGIISAVTGVIGTVTGIVGGIQSGKAAQQEAEYQANINKQNPIMILTFISKFLIIVFMIELKMFAIISPLYVYNNTQIGFCQ